MNRLEGLSTDSTVTQCGEVSGPAELLLRAFSGQLLQRRKRCLVLDSAAVEEGQIAKRLAEAVWAAQQHPVVIVVNKATSFSEVFSDLIVPAVLQDSLELLQPLHVALLITSEPYLRAVSQHPAAVEASSSLDVEVHRCSPALAPPPVLIDKKLEDEAPDDGIQSNQLAIATELVRRLLLIYFGELKLVHSRACAVGCGWIQVDSLAKWVT